MNKPADHPVSGEIEAYARLKLDEYGLHDWQFGWDRARRRLGVCRLQEKSITLSIHFVRANLEAPHEIQDTVLHEIAHALAWGPPWGNGPMARCGNASAGK